MRSRAFSSHGVTRAMATKNVRQDTAAADALVKFFATHQATNGQDFWQSGNCFSWGQQAMSAVIPAMPSMVLTGSTADIAATDGPVIGAMRRLRTAKAESNRDRKGQNVIPSSCHVLPDKERCRGPHRYAGQRDGVLSCLVRCTNKVLL
jgi:hypothetical protein